MRFDMTIKCPKCNHDNPLDTVYCGKCAALLTSASDIQPPLTKTMETPGAKLRRGTLFVDRYEIIEELGKGGMGQVFRVEDTTAKEEIALKLIKPEIAADGKTIERFRNELTLARKIRHKNVCGMYDLGEHEGISYITMEYVSGEDLKSLIRRVKRLDSGAAIGIAKQVCEGLAEAHRLGVIHRDLKPANIMIDKDGNARIMDFGIARSLQEKGLTGVGMTIGTPEYMSPEQKEGTEIDQRSDIYSMGIMLYEMITGKVTYDMSVQIPEGLKQVISKCLEEDRDKRYQSAEDLKKALVDTENKAYIPEKTLPMTKPKLKNPILIATVGIILVVIIALGILFLTGPEEKIESIAVLPLENLSGDPDQEYFVDGMTERLISELAKISGFQKVISSMSVMQYKGVRKSMPEIARELNVDAVVEGSVLIVENRVRITAQLIHAPTDRHLWAEDYENDLRDILTLQREVAKAIAQEIRIKLTPEEEMQLSKTSQIKPEAYQAYLKGLMHWNRRTGDDVKKAITYFEEAIAEEPDYALAYVGLADSYNILSFYSGARPVDSFPKAKAAALKAIALDETLGEAHNSLAYATYRYYWDFAEAESEFKRAIELNPNYASAHFWYGEYLYCLSRFDESLKKIHMALELDPVSLIINAFLGPLYNTMGQPEKGISQLQKTLDMDPNFAAAHYHFTFIYSDLNRYPEAIAAAKKAVELSPSSPLLIASLGSVYARAGQAEEANKILKELLELSKVGYTPPYWIAEIYAGLGDLDKAFEWLDKAFEDRDELLLYGLSSPVLHPVQADPRFSELMRRIGLEK